MHHACCKLTWTAVSHSQAGCQLTQGLRSSAEQTLRVARSILGQQACATVTINSGGGKAAASPKSASPGGSHSMASSNGNQVLPHACVHTVRALAQAGRIHQLVLISFSNSQQPAQQCARAEGTSASIIFQAVCLCKPASTQCADVLCTLSQVSGLQELSPSLSKGDLDGLSRALEDFTVRALLPGLEAQLRALHAQVGSSYLLRCAFHK